MSVALQFICGLAVTALVSFGVLAYLQKPLRKLLGELCGNDERAQFWTVFSNATVALVPLLAALQYPPAPPAGSSALIEIGKQFKWGLLGLVLSLVGLGKTLMSFIPRSAVSASSGPNVGAQRSSSL